jgi:transcription elongation factor
MEEKILLLGKHIIINEGDFKGVSGIVKSMNVISETTTIHNANNVKLLEFVQKHDIECEIIINHKNIITVSINCISKLT